MPNAQMQSSADHAIRPLLPSDLERVVEIDRDNTGHARRGFFENRLAAALSDPKAFIALAYTEHGKVEGFVLAHVLDGEFGGSRPATILDAIGMAQPARGHGGAHELMRELQAAAQRRNSQAVRTQVVWSDQAMTRFFANLGFKLGTRLVLERDCTMQTGERNQQATPATTTTAVIRSIGSRCGPWCRKTCSPSSALTAASPGGIVRPTINAR